MDKLWTRLWLWGRNQNLAVVAAAWEVGEYTYKDSAMNESEPGN